MRMKRMLRRLSAFAAGLCLLLTACAAPSVRLTAGDETAVVVQDKSCAYVIAYAKAADTAKPLAQIVQREIEALTGVSPDIVGDKVTADQKAIVLGFMEERADSVAAYDALQTGDYAIAVGQQDICVAARTVETLKEAVSLLTERAMKEENGVLTVTAYTAQADGEVVEDITDYTIVYGAGNDMAESAASWLQKSIRRVLGTDLALTDDSAAQSDREILIGDTNRLTVADAKKTYSLRLQTQDYVFVGEKERLAVLTESPSLIGVAVDALLADTTDGILSAAHFSWRTGAAVGSGINTTDRADKADGADIRILSWNILNPKWGGTEVTERVGYFMQNLYYYRADVIGLQEAAQPWQEQLSALPAPYAFIGRTTDSGAPNMTCMLYNTDTLNLVESGTIDIEPKSEIRVITWAVLEIKASGKRVLVTNTHPDARADVCSEHLKIFLDKMQRLRETYDLPTLSVGDFNSTETSASYKAVVADGFVDCKFADGVTVLRDRDSYLKGDFGGIVTTGMGSRDHVFFKGAVTPLAFNTVVDNGVRLVSDHLPVYADVQIA